MNYITEESSIDIKNDIIEALFVNTEKNYHMFLSKKHKLQNNIA